MAQKRLLLLMAVLLLMACKKERKPQGEIIARVNGIYLLEEDLNILQVQGFSWSEEDKSRLLDNWIRSTLLYLGAKEEGLDQDPLLKRKLLWSERMLLAQEYLKRKAEGITVSDEEIDDFLKDRKELFKQGVSVVIVFFSDSSRAAYVRRLLSRRGRRYRYAIEELRNQGDINVTELDSVNLGYFFLEFRGIPDVLKEKLRWMRKGQVSGVFSADGEYVVIKLLERFPLVPQMAEVRAYIHQVLYEKKRSALEDSLVNALREKFVVEEISGGS